MEPYQDLPPQYYFFQVVPMRNEITVLDLTLAVGIGVLILSLLCLVLEKWLEEELKNNEINHLKNKPRL